VLVTLVTSAALNPLSAPLLVHAFAGDALALSPLRLGINLLLILAGSAAGAMLVRAWLGAEAIARTRKSPGPGGGTSSRRSSAVRGAVSQRARASIAPGSACTGVLRPIGVADAALENEVGAVRRDADVAQEQGAVELGDAEVADRLDAGAEDLRRDADRQAVDQPGAQQRRDQRRAALDHHRADPARGQRGGEPAGGLPALRRKSLALTQRFIELVEQRCAGHGLELITPRDPHERGSQASFARAEGGYAIVQALIARGVIGDFRAPDVVRFGLTPLYLRFEDVWEAVRRLRAILDTGRWRDPRFAVRGKVT
jgi:hypothetical protein